MVPLLDQFYYFAITIIIGMVAGLCYDLYKVTRGTLKLRKVGTALGDSLFWVVLTCLVFVLLLLGNWGEVRLYVLLGLILGVVIYLNFLSRQATSILQWTFMLINKSWRLFIRGLKMAYRIVCFPIKMIYLSVAIPLGLAVNVLRKTFSGIKFIFNKTLGRPVRKVKKSLRSRFSSIFPIFEYKDDD